MGAGAGVSGRGCGWAIFTAIVRLLSNPPPPPESYKRVARRAPPHTPALWPTTLYTYIPVQPTIAALCERDPRAVTIVRCGAVTCGCLCTVSGDTIACLVTLLLVG